MNSPSIIAVVLISVVIVGGMMLHSTFVELYTGIEQQINMAQPNYLRGENIGLLSNP